MALQIPSPAEPLAGTAVAGKRWYSFFRELLRTKLDKTDPEAARETIGIVTGTYTPTLTNVTNLDGSTSGVCTYVRVGDVVTVFGSLAADATAAAGATTDLGISLPVASDFADLGECAGLGSIGQSAWGRIFGDTTNNRANLRWSAQSTSDLVVAIHFSYRVI